MVYLHETLVCETILACMYYPPEGQCNQTSKLGEALLSIDSIIYSSTARYLTVAETTARLFFLQVTFFFLLVSSTG